MPVCQTPYEDPAVQEYGRLVTARSSRGGYGGISEATNRSNLPVPSKRPAAASKASKQQQRQSEQEKSPTTGNAIPGTKVKPTAEMVDQAEQIRQVHSTLSQLVANGHNNPNLQAALQQVSDAMASVERPPQRMTAIGEEVVAKLQSMMRLPPNTEVHHHAEPSGHRHHHQSQPNYSHHHYNHPKSYETQYDYGHYSTEEPMIHPQVQHGGMMPSAHHLSPAAVPFTPIMNNDVAGQQHLTPTRQYRAQPPFGVWNQHHASFTVTESDSPGKRFAVPQPHSQTVHHDVPVPLSVVPVNQGYHTKSHHGGRHSTGGPRSNPHGVKTIVIAEFKRKRYRRCEYHGFVDVGQHVIIEGDRGKDCGLAVAVTHYDAETHRQLSTSTLSPDVDITRVKGDVCHVYRVASKAEVDVLFSEIAALEEEALSRCHERVSFYNLPIQLLECEYQFDKKKVTFYFDSEVSVDFRDLVKDLYRQFNTRIWLENVNSKVKNVVPEGAVGKNEKAAGRAVHGKADEGFSRRQR